MRPDVHEVVEPVTAEHVRELAAHLRPEDAAEVTATVGGPAVVAAAPALMRAVVDSLSDGGEVRALLLEHQVAAIWGVHPLMGFDGPCGSVWMLTTTAVERHWRLFARLSRAEVQRLLRRYQVLFNHIDVRYVRALRWAVWTGAELQAPRPFGVQARDFVPAIWRREAPSPPQGGDGGRAE